MDALEALEWVIIIAGFIVSVAALVFALRAYRNRG